MPSTACITAVPWYDVASQMIDYICFHLNPILRRRRSFSGFFQESALLRSAKDVQGPVLRKKLLGGKFGGKINITQEIAKAH